MGCLESRSRIMVSLKRFCIENQFKMYAALQTNDFATYSKLVEKGFDIDFRMPNFSMKAPAHIAAEFGSVYILQDLIKRKANLENKDVNGVTPVFYAIRNKKVNCAIVLENNGADLDAVSKQGLKPKDYIPKGKEKIYTKLFRDVRPHVNS